MRRGLGAVATLATFGAFTTVAAFATFARGLLAERRLEATLFTRVQVATAGEHARAGVPSQQRLVVTGWPIGLGLLVPLHRLAKPFVRDLAGSWQPAIELRLASALADDAGVICALVLVAEAWQQL